MLRIISGKYKGNKIKYLNSESLHPTIERIRESIFNIIQFKIKNSIVLDLFAGSGIFAIESISRGATKALICDNNPKAISIITNNLQNLGIKNYDLFLLDYTTLLKSKHGAKIDIIFIDPPYMKNNYYDTSLKLIADLDLLSKNGCIIIEKKVATIIKIPSKLIIAQEKKYGNKSLLIVNKI